MAALEDGDTGAFGPELPAMFDGVKLAAVATVLYVIVRCLNLKSTAQPPEIVHQDTPLSRYLFKSCPMLTKEYIPPLLWGKSGHLQTALYGKMGRVNTPTLSGTRKFLPMPDGATATFDLFEALGDHSTGDDVTMVICPGIGNHSEKNYIRTFVDHSQRRGYRCAVLNHLGALPNVELTSPRMFTYETMPNVTFALTQHGGHLGFFEGAMLFPQPLTWMDKVVVQYADAVCHWDRSRPACRRSGGRRDVSACLKRTRVIDRSLETER
ncbi:Monoacylglycerol lipase ABHD2-A [Liparis tanakae]|uniref:Monoacylglycerol lipase ABHD2-A n=1 Tax=Liparis tanakae TaxID=230148 RepID=A0A4Z2IQ37_9TELE|nr:Monoacylglycerol lipase ABHD2-A [Liparis tanakae]